ncbi:MAG: hypothetical protein EZS28_047470, partial [Streblomastix strix]
VEVDVVVVEEEECNDAYDDIEESEDKEEDEDEQLELDIPLLFGYNDQKPKIV